jgi:DNA-binding CsgD family transcriptional regulator
MDADVLLARGGQALGAGDWGEARTVFRAVLAIEEHPQALRGLAEALWWLAEAAVAVETMERAHVVLSQEGEVAAAVQSAVWLATIYKKSLGNEAAARGWVSRADSLLDEIDDEVLPGWVALARAYAEGDTVRAVASAWDALERGRQGADVDLELSAMSELGSALVAGGEVVRGLDLVDEAMVRVFAGEYGSPSTVCAATCSMLTACDRAADLGRVTQWCRVADRFMRTYGCPFLYADCRGRYGSVLVSTGHWVEAEEELQNALRSAPPGTDYHDRGLVSLADLRVRQGRPEEAEVLLAEAPERLARPVLAHAALVRGEHDLAVALLRRHMALRDVAEDLSETLALLVESLLATEDTVTARRVLDELRDEEAAHGTASAAGHSALAAGRTAMAEHRPESAVSHLERAVDHFAEAGLPYWTGVSRLVLAEALSATEEPVAVREAQRAYATLDGLGAARLVDQAAALVRSLGGPGRTGPRTSPQVLTEREEEVLQLLGEALSNPEIAERLYISRRTVAHHVSHVLAKLGLRNRAEAAAYHHRTGQA